MHASVFILFGKTSGHAAGEYVCRAYVYNDSATYTSYFINKYTYVCDIHIIKYYVYVAELLYTYVCDIHIILYYVHVTDVCIFNNKVLCVCQNLLLCVCVCQNLLLCVSIMCMSQNYYTHTSVTYTY